MKTTPRPPFHTSSLSLLTSVALSSFILLTSHFALASAKEDPFKKLASDLAAESPPGQVNVGVGNFAYENTDLLSPFSSMLRDELEIALGETGKFKVVTRDRLADLQMEGKFQGKGILEPGTGVEKVTIEGVKGIIRGRFYATGDEVTVYAELAWLEGREINKARLAIPLLQGPCKNLARCSRCRLKTDGKRDQTPECRAEPRQCSGNRQGPSGQCAKRFPHRDLHRGRQARLCRRRDHRLPRP